MKIYKILAFSVFCLCIASCTSKIPVKIDTVDLLPNETAIRFLEVHTPCTFNTKGMLSDSGELIPYDDLEFGVQHVFSWEVTVCKQGMFYKFGGMNYGCTLLGLEQNASYDTAKNVVIALKSLGVKDVKDGNYNEVKETAKITGTIIKMIVEHKTEQP